MSIAHSRNQNSLDFVEQIHPSWSHQFNPTERQRMMQADSTALGTMSLILVSIVTLGLALVGATVAFIVFGG